MSAPAWTTESFAPAADPLRVDRDQCVVYGVRATGPESRNGHVYPEAVLRKYLRLFDGAPCYWGHQYLAPGSLAPNPDPPPGAKLGRHTNPRIEGGGVRTDVRYNPKNAHAEEFLWACEHDPAHLCFSQHARVGWLPDRDSQGRKVAGAYLDLSSVDVVGRGGTTSTVFESDRSKGKGMTIDPQAIAAELDTPGAVIDFLTGFLGALSGLDQPTKDQILQSVVQGLTAGATAPPDDATGDAAGPAVESLRRLGPVGRWAAAKLDGVFVAEAARTRRRWADGFIAAQGLDPKLRTDLLVELVAESYGNEARAKALVADRKHLGGAGGPRQGPPGGGPKSVKDLVSEYAAG